MRISRRKKHNVKISKTFFRYNEKIKFDEVRVVDENGEHIGVMPTSKAIELAREKELDLVEINPAARPPVAKIMEYGQFKYQQEKQEKNRLQKQKEVGTKGVRLSPKIGKHDLDIRKNQAVKFLEKGQNVKIEIILRGREKGHTEVAFSVIDEFIKGISELVKIKIEQPTKRLGTKITALIAPTGTVNKQDIKSGDEESEIIEQE